MKYYYENYIIYGWEFIFIYINIILDIFSSEILFIINYN
jgi:hypothetical protein